MHMLTTTTDHRVLTSQRETELIDPYMNAFTAHIIYSNAIVQDLTFLPPLPDLQECDAVDAKSLYPTPFTKVASQGP